MKVSFTQITNFKKIEYNYMKTKKTENQKLQSIRIKKTIPTIHTQKKKKKKLPFKFSRTLKFKFSRTHRSNRIWALEGPASTQNCPCRPNSEIRPVIPLPYTWEIDLGFQCFTAIDSLWKNTNSAQRVYRVRQDRNFKSPSAYC